MLLHVSAAYPAVVLLGFSLEFAGATVCTVRNPSAEWSTQ
ncbi:hypothetical protein PF002_g8887 [Phytophthora fragariae]|uniref:Uncharacterized protein n=1 Tax=Phytophthora fragariae TaxID=53985 RepID=A0A6A3FAI7_9STRA|nr:hypothetical protein PF003_g1034 [Phytophthora fragariae]KAE8941636.1 hypothetical protein PF009_g8579 [Phytophthora fragariae]KAE9120767.1 hypothetical protein PF007_g8044 [Phytophthora fragariae]KAE9242181.1 hypothetical protein PF002_g8887 [Phytophthora fragariae]